MDNIEIAGRLGRLQGRVEALRMIKLFWGLYTSNVIGFDDMEEEILKELERAEFEYKHEDMTFYDKEK